MKHSRYDTISRNAWLWVSGMLASNAGWAFAFELYNEAVLFSAFSLTLFLLFLTQKPREVSSGA